MKPFLLGGLVLALSACASPPPQYASRMDAWKQRNSTLPPPGPAPELAPRPRIEDLLRIAEDRNPRLRGAFEDWRAALEELPQAVALPDPRLSVSVALSELQTRNGPVRGRLGLSQPFPWPGTLSTAGRRAAERAEASRLRYAATRLAVRRDLRVSWSEYAYLQSALVVARGQLSLLQQLHGVAQTLFSTGKASQSDVIRLQVEIGDLNDQIQGLEDRRSSLTARIAALLDLPAGTVVGWPSQDALEDLVIPVETEPEALAQNPELLAAEHRIAAAQAGIELAELAFYPDFSVGAEWSPVGNTSLPGAPDPGRDGFGLAFGIEIPFQRGRLRAGAAQAEARSRSAEAMLRTTRTRLEAELADALYRARDAERRLTLYRDGLIPKSEEAFRATLTSYQADGSSFDSLIDTERALLQFELDAARALSDRANARADLLRLTALDPEPDA